MARINPKITIRPVYFGMLLLSATVMTLAGCLTATSELHSLEVASELASELDSLKEAARQGDVEVQLYLGYKYFTGDSIPQNPAEAARWYRMAAEQGIVEAQFQLGIMYFDGSGVPQNYTEAARWYRMAAEQGDAGAQFYLGLIYHYGFGVPKDYVQAYAWYNIAAAQGRETAKELLENITKEMTAAGITKAQELSREYWEAYGPNRASSK